MGLISDNNTLANLVHIAYSVKSESKLAKKMLHHLPDGWALLDTSKANSGKYAYKAAAFINEKTKEIVIANAGTKPHDAYDLIDDAFIATGRTPYKISSIKSFITEIQEQVTDIENYDFSTSGHSLGAIASDLCALELQSRGLKVTSSTTFENPGSAPVIDYAIENNLFSGKEVSITDIEFDVFNVRPNFINTANSQLGKTHLVVPKNNVEISTEEVGQAGFFSFLTSKVGNVAKASADLLGITAVAKASADLLGITAFTKSVNEHKLGNFLKHYADEETDHSTLAVDEWYSTTNKQTVLSYDKTLMEKAKTISASGDKYVMYNTEEVEGFDFIDMISLSGNNLRTCAYDADMIGDVDIDGFEIV